jgi:hypothetical protein
MYNIAAKITDKMARLSDGNPSNPDAVLEAMDTEGFIEEVSSALSTESGHLISLQLWDQFMNDRQKWQNVASGGKAR